MVEFWAEALKAIPDADGILHAISVIELHYARSYYIVNAWAEAAAGDDGSFGLGGIEKNFLARSGHLERKGCSRAILNKIEIEIDIVKDPFGIRRKIADVYGRRDGAFPQTLNGEIIMIVFVIHDF